MKILQIHKYYSREKGAGSVTAFFELVKILKKRGHQVSIFSMKDVSNEATRWDKYFTEHFDLNDNTGLLKKIRLSFKVIYNFEAKKKLESLLQAERPDVAHLHNIYHYLSPSIIDSLRKYNVPIVMTLHAYKEICPNYKLFVKGKVCERCNGGRYYQCFLNRCLKDSFPKSFLAMLEAYFHKYKKTYQKVDLFLAPSHFLKKKYVEFGIPEEKITVLRNIFSWDDFESSENNREEKDCFIYFGRLAEEKGLENLIRAVSQLKERKTLGRNKLYIIGQGPQEKYLKILVAKLDLNKEVLFLGFKKRAQVKELILESKFSVIPSIWYENSPMTIVEAQLLGKPLIVSDRGGSQESILKDKSGYVFRAEDQSDLADKIEKMLSLSEEERMAMGQKGAQNVRALYDEEKIYAKLMEIYASLSRSGLPK